MSVVIEQDVILIQHCAIPGMSTYGTPLTRLVPLPHIAVETKISTKSCVPIFVGHCAHYRITLTRQTGGKVSKLRSLIWTSLDMPVLYKRI